MNDGVLNLSTFGEIIQKPENQDELTFADILSQIIAPAEEEEEEVVVAEEPIEIEGPRPHNYNEFIRCTFEYALCIKMMHWQTMLLGEHKATDELFLGMLPILDQIVETAAGKYGRPHSSNWQIPVCNYESPEHTAAFVEEMAHCYSTKCKSLFDPQNDAEILNTLDTLIELINKSRYLLTLK
jgi:hypothetical protein